MKKRTLTMLIALVAALALATTGTLAYLTDTDSDVNVMTLGNVNIEQHEYQRVQNADGTYEQATIDDQNSYVLEPYEQAKPLYPIFGDPSLPGDDPMYAGFDETQVRMTQVDSYGSMQVFAGKGALDKFVTVENTGSSDAYVRTLIAFECGDTNTEMIGKSARSTSADDAATSTQPWIETEIGKITVDGNDYILFEYLYRGGKLSESSYRHENGVLPAGETTYPSLCQVYMRAAATNEDVQAVDGNGNGLYEILVVSQAVQTTNFESLGAEAALDAAFGDVTTTSHPWIGDVEGLPTKTVSTAAELEAALAEGGTIVLEDDIILNDETAFTVPAGVKAELVLNGKTISQENAPTATYALITNKGELTITGEGTITYADVNNYTADVGYACNTIRNEGVLNIEGGVIANETALAVKDYSYPHAIDTYQGSVVNITGGTVKSANYDCIRMFCNSTTQSTEVNISGGNIINRVSFQNPTSNQPGYGRLNISGGTFTTTDGVNANVRLLNFSSDISNMKANVTGGTFDAGYKTQDYGNVTDLNSWITIADGVTLNVVE